MMSGRVLRQADGEIGISIPSLTTNVPMVYMLTLVTGVRFSLLYILQYVLDSDVNRNLWCLPLVMDYWQQFDWYWPHCRSGYGCSCCRHVLGQHQRFSQWYSWSKASSWLRNACSFFFRTMGLILLYYVERIPIFCLLRK